MTCSNEAMGGIGMKKKASSTIWGLVFIALGLCIAGKIFFGWSFNLFFDGWWTLFIIIPCVSGIIEKGWNSGDVIGATIGGALLLMCQDIIPSDIFFRMLPPAILVLIGLSMIFKGCFNGSKNVKVHMEPGLNDYVGIFNAKKVHVPTEKFVGCTANAVFGGVDIDLRDAIIDEDIVIDATAVFGGIDIYVPPYVRVKVSSVPIFGCVRNKAKEPEDFSAPTVFLNATCMFGGVDIK